MLSKQVRWMGNQTFGYLLATRGIQQNAKLNQRAEFKPVQIDVPWGKVEAKLWGSENKQPVLAIHGWMDNAGSFDKIAPLLKHSSVLAIDLPGHGKSSWPGAGAIYSQEFYVKSVRAIIRKLGWKKVKILAHSMGGQVSFSYATMFPDETQFVISIDILTNIPSQIIKHSNRQAKAIDKFISFEEKCSDNPPSYPEEVAIDKWIKAVPFSKLDVPSIKTLMIRGAKRKDDGSYSFARDYRISINGFNPCYSLENLIDITQSITCPYMIIKAAQSTFKDTFYKEVLDVLKANSADFQHVVLNGHHHLHMMQAQEVADAINPFLEKHDV